MTKINPMIPNFISNTIHEDQECKLIVETNIRSGNVSYVFEDKDTESQIRYCSYSELLESYRMFHGLDD